MEISTGAACAGHSVFFLGGGMAPAITWGTPDWSCIPAADRTLRTMTHGSCQVTCCGGMSAHALRCSSSGQWYSGQLSHLVAFRMVISFLLQDLKQTTDIYRDQNKRLTKAGFFFWLTAKTGVYRPTLQESGVFLLHDRRQTNRTAMAESYQPRNDIRPELSKSIAMKIRTN